MKWLFSRFVDISAAYIWFRFALSMVIARYSKFVVTFPRSILVFGIVASYAITLLTLVFVEWPDISDPTEGFNTSGTDISDKLATFRYLQANIGPGKYFHQFSDESSSVKISKTRNGTVLSSKKVRISSRKRKNRTKSLYEGHRLLSDDSDCNATGISCADSKNSNEEPRFCRIDLDMRNSSNILEPSSCDDRNIPINCSTYEIHILFAYLLPRPESSNISVLDTDVALFVAPIYQADVPFTPYFKNHDSRSSFLTRFQRQLNSLGTKPELELIGANLGLYNELFSDYLYQDLFYGIPALFLVFICLWFNTRSIFLTLFMISVIFPSLGVAYAIYVLAFARFFPFVNLLTLILMIGLGVDDALIFMTAWKQAKSTKNATTLEKLISKTLKSAGPTMFVTSLTTVIALMTNLFSEIFVLKYFGLFASLAITTNFIFTMILLPPFFVVIETWLGSSSITLSKCCSCCRKKDLLPDGLEGNNSSSIIVKKIVDLLDIFQELGSFANKSTQTIIYSIFPFLIIQFKYIWLAIFSVGVCISAYLVFIYPGFKVPINRADSLEFFHDYHPFERWNNHLRYNFDDISKDYLAGRNFSMPMHIIFGIDSKLAQNGDFLLRVWSNESFNLGSNRALLFFADFCNSLRFSVNFTTKLDSPTLLPHCFVPDFFDWMRAPCKNLIGEDQQPCCRDFAFPYYLGVFDLCLRKFLDRYPPHVKLALAQQPYVTGPLLDNNFNFRALIISFPSIYNLTADFETMHHFHSETNRFIEKLLTEGPVDVRKGWFVSDLLDFYDLQRALVVGVKYSVISAVGVAVLIVFLAIGNLMIGLLCAFCICSVILLTIASMVLLGWHLNILESTIIVLAIGISFDYTLHFASVSKRLIEGVNILHNTERCGDVLTRRLISKASPSVSGAAMTTALVGFAMLPAQTVAFYRIGVFMIIITTWSWLCSHFLYCPLICMSARSLTCPYLWLFWTKQFRHRKPAFQRTGSKISYGTHRVSNKSHKLFDSTHSKRNSKLEDLFRRRSLPVTRICK